MVRARQSQRHRVALLSAVWAPVVAGVLALDLRLLAAAWGSARAAHQDVARFDDLVTGLAMVVLATTLTWLSVAVTACLVSECGRVGARLTGPVAAVLAPRGLRLLVRLACGVALAGPLGALPATAAEPTGGTCDSIACAGPLAGLPLPDRPDVTARRMPRSDTDVAPARTVPPMSRSATPVSAPAAPPATVTVQQGDSLWSIAAAHLPDGARDNAIAAAWPRWHQTNRAVIGPDPDLIHPGTELIVPDDLNPPSSSPTTH